MVTKPSGLFQSTYRYVTSKFETNRFTCRSTLKDLATKSQRYCPHVHHSSGPFPGTHRYTSSLFRPKSLGKTCLTWPATYHYCLVPCPWSAKWPCSRSHALRNISSNQLSPPHIFSGLISVRFWSAPSGGERKFSKNRFLTKSGIFSCGLYQMTPTRRT